ncbi:MAG: hypothetical protein IPI66_05495 [Chitinophagaceae bacterium]|nr:hypothetical protein [Chitinophagaceae bacterium]
MKRILFLLFFSGQTVVAQTDCNPKFLPIVFVHGFLASGDTWSSQVQRFSSNGFCEDRLFVFDWNTIGRKPNPDSLLDVFIRGVLAKTKALQVNLVGHSAGTGLCYGYLKDSAHASQVAHYVNIAGFKMKTAAGASGQVPTMNIYSVDDKVIRGGGEIPGAENIRQTGKDHLQTASCEETFAAMFSFFTGSKQNPIPGIVPSTGPFVRVGGRAVQLGDNQPLTDSFIVYLFDPKTGKRDFIQRNAPTGSYTGWNRFAADGTWGFDLVRDAYMEFEVHPENGRTLFYYFEPPVRDDLNRYLRAIPQSGLIAKMLGNIPGDEQQTALVIFTSSQAVIAGRDTLAIDEVPLSVQAIAPADKTAIAVFVFDDGDGQTSGNPLAGYKATPFLTGSDVFIKADDKRSMRIFFNGRTMVLPKRKSKDGIMIAVFN